jgi:hypothetical protein
MSRGRFQIARVAVPVAMVLLVVGVLWLRTGIALACSGPPYDVNRADVIAEGWIDHVDISPEAAGVGPFHAVQLTMRVVRSLKGDAPTPLVFTDSSSYFPDPSGGPNGFWAGSSGACGVLDDDPTGQYALVVFERHDGELGTALFMGAVFRDGPDDPKIERFRRYLEARLVPGDSPRVVPVRAAWQDWLTLANWPYLLAATLMTMMFTAVGVLWVRERWRNA